MKNDAGKKLRLGLFVFGAAVFLTIGIYFTGQKQRLFAKTFNVKVVFRDISGLQIGNAVRFAGINIGNVERIAIITDTSVEVGLTLDKSVKKFIKTDATASVGSEGLMGDKLVNISAGSEGSKEIDNNGYLMASSGSNIDALMDQLTVTATNAAQISGDLADIMQNIHAGRGVVGQLFMDSTLAQNLDKSMVNIRQGTGGFKDDMEAAKHNFLLRGYFKKKEKEAAKKESVKAEPVN